MKKKKLFGKIRSLLAHFRSKLKQMPAKSAENRPETTGGNKSPFGQARSLAYELIGEKTLRILPLFKGLDTSLQKSGMKVNFKSYVSLTVLAAILISAATFVVIPCVLLLFHIPLLAAALFGLGGSMFGIAFSIVGFYVYPLYRADKLRRDLDDELPFTTGYMAILASAGVSPEKIFHSLSNLSVPLTVSAEAKNIVRDVNLFGLDILSSLEEASKRTPSERFHEMLEGFISTIHSGGDLTAYLREKSTQYMKLKRISLRKFSDNLSMLSEFYVALLITGPLLLVIMLAVMAMLGGGGLGILGPDLILNILTYVGIPLGSIMFLIILDSSSPKW